MGHLEDFINSNSFPIKATPEAKIFRDSLTYQKNSNLESNMFSLGRTKRCLQTARPFS